MASLLDPVNFPMMSDTELKSVGIRTACRRLLTYFPEEPIGPALQRLASDPTYIEWTMVRHILAHRAAPGRHMTVSIQASISGTVNTSHRAPDQWKVAGGIPLNTDITSRRKWLGQSLSRLLAESAAFSQSHF